MEEGFPRFGNGRMTGSRFTLHIPWIEGGQLKEKEVAEVGDLKIYFNQYRVTKKGHPVNLTTKEFEVLVLMAANPGRKYKQEYTAWEKECKEGGIING